jgi:hypothetical protein
MEDVKRNTKSKISKYWKKTEEDESFSYVWKTSACTNRAMAGNRDHLENLSA